MYRVDAKGPQTASSAAALRAMSVLFAGAVKDPTEHLARVLGDPDCDAERAVTIAMRSVGSDHIQPLIDAARERASVLVEESEPLIELIAEALVERGSLGAQEIRLIKENYSDGIET